MVRSKFANVKGGGKGKREGKSERNNGSNRERAVERANANEAAAYHLAMAKRFQREAEGAVGETKRRDSDWDCLECGDVQFAKNTECRKCGEQKPGGSGAPAGGAVGEAKRKSGVSDWDCLECGDVQFAKNTECRKCGAQKPARSGGRPASPYSPSGGRPSRADRLMPSAKGKSFGKGKPSSAKKAKLTMDDIMKDKIKAVDPSLKLWVGGLSDTTTWKTLADHFEQLFAKPKIVDIMRGGKSACISYETTAEVLLAAVALNTTEVDGNIIEVGQWGAEIPEERRQARKEKGGRGMRGEDGEGNAGDADAADGEQREKKPKRVRVKPGKGPREGKGKPSVNQGGKFAKRFAEGEMQHKQNKAALEHIDHACKVYVGGLPDDVSLQEVIDFFEPFVGIPKVTDLRRKGTACVAFESDVDVFSAIASCNGADLNGSTITVDEWTRPVERRVKKDDDEPTDAPTDADY